MEEKTFDEQIKEMCEKRKMQQMEWWNSIDGRAYEIIVDFKCWCHSKGYWHDLDANLFKEYCNIRTERFSQEMYLYIYTKYFGYKFEYDYKKMKYTTKIKGNKKLLERS